MYIILLYVRRNKVLYIAAKKMIKNTFSLLELFRLNRYLTTLFNTPLIKHNKSGGHYDFLSSLCTARL